MSYNGRGGRSIYGPTFASENYEIEYYGAGWMGMANRGVDTNTSQLFYTTGRNMHILRG